MSARPKPTRPIRNLAALGATALALVTGGIATRTALANESAAGAAKAVEVVRTLWLATVIRSTKANERIEALEFESESVPVEVRVETEKTLVPQVRLVGKLATPGWSLLFGRAVIVKGSPKPGTFELPVPLTEKITVVNLTAVGPMGELKSEKILVDFTNRKTYDQEVTSGVFLSKARSLKRHYVSPSIGVSSLGYTQTGLAKKIGADVYSAILLTVKAGYQFTLSQYFDIGINAYFNALPITSSSAEYSMRFLGVNLRAGYAIPFIRPPFRLSVLGGVYYVTTFVTGDMFGFKNLMGPQIYPILRYQLPAGNAMYVYGKFSPVASGFKLLSMDTREIAAGGGYSHPLGNGHPLSVMLDVAMFQIVLPTASAAANSYTLSVGYGL